MINIVPKPERIETTDGEFTFGRDYREQVSARFDSTLEDGEGYVLTIGDGITIDAKDERGVFYACKTLEQLALSKTVPRMTITDRPRFPHRGFLIDCVRHFFTVEQLKKMIDAAALFKMNIFHWHLTDDQGWRIEIKKYPELVRTGSVRNFSDFGGVVETGRHEGFYTQTEIREVVEYCKKRYIEIIPEIEMPGHTSALLASIDGLSCKKNVVEIKTGGGVFIDVVCASSPRVKQIFADILAEVAELFPGPIIHIGGDEAPQSNWSECESCQKYMAEHGIKNEALLQADFMQEMARVVTALGKKAMVWNDALKCGELSPDVTLQYWMGDKKTTAEHAARGGNIVMSDFFHYYVDYSYGQTPLRKTYNFEPADRLFADAVVGVEANLWTEHIRDFGRLTYMAYPRMAAVAESGWTMPENKDAAEFFTRFEAVSQLLLHIGVIPAPRKDWAPGLFGRLKSLIKFALLTISGPDIKRFLHQLAREWREKKRTKE